MRQSSLMKYSLLGITQTLLDRWSYTKLNGTWPAPAFEYKNNFKNWYTYFSFFSVNKLDKISDKQGPNGYRLTPNNLRDHSICPAFSIYIGCSEIFCIRSSSFITEIKGFTRYVASLKFKYLWKVYKTDRVRAIFQYTILRKSKQIKGNCHIRQEDVWFGDGIMSTIWTSNDLEGYRDRYFSKKHIKYSNIFQ